MWLGPSSLQSLLHSPAPMPSAASHGPALCWPLRCRGHSCWGVCLGREFSCKQWGKPCLARGSCCLQTDGERGRVGSSLLWWIPSTQVQTSETGTPSSPPCPPGCPLWSAAPRPAEAGIHQRLLPLPFPASAALPARWERELRTRVLGAHFPSSLWSEKSWPALPQFLIFYDLKTFPVSCWEAQQQPQVLRPEMGSKWPGPGPSCYRWRNGAYGEFKMCVQDHILNWETGQLSISPLDKCCR